MYFRIQDLALLLSHGIVAIFQKVIYCSCNDYCFVFFCFAILWGLPHYVHSFLEGEGVELSRSQPLSESGEDYCEAKFSIFMDLVWH